MADAATIATTDVVARMGDVAVSGVPGEVLVSVGLGSCIGLALVSRRLRVCGLAHIMLPDSQGRDSERPGKFADHALPALLERLAARGATVPTLQGVVVGGAQMFASSGMEIGARNEDAVRKGLTLAGITVVAAATGGSVGRTIRVHVETGTVTVREAGSQEVTLL